MLGLHKLGPVKMVASPSIVLLIHNVQSVASNTFDMGKPLTVGIPLVQ